MNIKPLTDKERFALRIQFEREEARRLKHRLKRRAKRAAELRASNLDLISNL